MTVDGLMEESRGECIVGTSAVLVVVVRGGGGGGRGGGGGSLAETKSCTQMAKGW